MNLQLFSLQSRVDTPHEVATAFQYSLDVGLTNGLLLAIPNPSPAESQPIQDAIDTAIRSLAAATTTTASPYLLLLPLLLPILLIASQTNY